MLCVAFPSVCLEQAIKTLTAITKHHQNFDPRKTVEPPHAAAVYNNAVRAKMHRWYGKGANGKIYQFYSDNAGTVHFSGIVPESAVPKEMRKLLDITMSIMPNRTPNFPLTIGDASLFAVKVDLDESYHGKWLFGKIAYIIENTCIGDYELGTSLRDVLVQMNYIISDSNQRKTSRFIGKPKEVISDLAWTTIYGNVDTGFEQVAQEECWAKHDITLPLDVFSSVRVYQFDEGVQSRIIWRDLADIKSPVTYEIRVPLGTTEEVFKQLEELLDSLLQKEELEGRN